MPNGLTLEIFNVIFANFLPVLAYDMKMTSTTF